MAFKDAAHTRDLISAGLSLTPGGACMGGAPNACTEAHPDRSKWCHWCKAKNPTAN